MIKIYKNKNSGSQGVLVVSSELIERTKSIDFSVSARISMPGSPISTKTVVDLSGRLSSK